MDADTGEGGVVSDNFYRAFEERYYAPRDLIKRIRRQYLPFVEPLHRSIRGAARSTSDVVVASGWS